MPLHHFLISYDTRRQALLEAVDLGSDDAAALAAYADKEREHRAREDIEIVLIGADSLATIKQTHPHYFDGAGSGAGFFEELIVTE